MHRADLSDIQDAASSWAWKWIL